FRQAVAIMERLPTLTPMNHYDLACYHALLSGVAARPDSGLSSAEGQAEADRALHWLRQALAAGYRVAGLMQRDTDLDPLRSRPDSQLLMMDEAFPGEPFAR